MIWKAYILVFEGFEASVIEVQWVLSANFRGFLLALPNNSMSETRDRVRSKLGWIRHRSSQEIAGSRLSCISTTKSRLP